MDCILIFLSVTIGLIMLYVITDIDNNANAIIRCR